MFTGALHSSYLNKSHSASIYQASSHFCRSYKMWERRKGCYPWLFKYGIVCYMDNVPMVQAIMVSHGTYYRH